MSELLYSDKTTQYIAKIGNMYVQKMFEYLTTIHLTHSEEGAMPLTEDNVKKLKELIPEVKVKKVVVTIEHFEDEESYE